MPIHILSKQDAQKIAAGEVIERPSNALKELIEDSIDAQANYIEIAVYEGGKRSMRITDNGVGMSPEDAQLCFKRYATSKLSSFEELTSVQTFGFRGEALASIAMVNKVTLITRQANVAEGLQLTIQEGAIIAEQPVGAPVGTTFILDDLFYNIPARKKFLKATSTEFNQILTLFKAFCLSYPDIHFSLSHDGINVYNCPPTQSLLTRIAQLFDQKVSTAALEIIPTTSADIAISGIVTGPQYGRYDRGALYFFVNDRLVKNIHLTRALMKGLNNVLPPDKYPLAVIRIYVDPQTVDVNVHPKKEEVSFLHPYKVEQAITLAIKSTLEAHVQTRLQHTQMHQFSQQLPAADVFKRSFTAVDPFALHTFAKTSTIQTYSAKDQPLPEALTQEPATIHPPQETSQASFKESHHYSIIGQHKTTYILLEHPEGLLIVDQHAAHERILYEQFSKKFESVETVELLFPPLITCTEHEITVLTPYLEVLKKQGVVVEQFGPSQVRVLAVPVYAKQLNLHQLIPEYISWIMERDSDAEDAFIRKLTGKLRAQLACKAAIKAGMVLSLKQMETLLRDLEKTDNSFSCPHGRPTQWLLYTHEIEKKFKRIM